VRKGNDIRNACGVCDRRLVKCLFIDRHAVVVAAVLRVGSCGALRLCSERVRGRTETEGFVLGRLEVVGITCKDVVFF
jgi:hypothetical protein